MLATMAVLLTLEVWVSSRAQRHQQRVADRATALDAINTSRELPHPATFVTYHALKGLKRLEPHEKLRDLGLLHVIDVRDDLFVFVAHEMTVFVSHQWLGSTEPDVDGHHFAALLASCEDLSRRFSLDPIKLFVWIDYVSIPQANASLRDLAIESLPIYASSCRLFVILTPEVTHHDLLTIYNNSSYLKRGWCRMEQWARMSHSGVDDMYLFEKEVLSSLVAQQETWVETVFRVFEGDFSNESDKWKLVVPMLELWARVVRYRKVSASIENLHTLISRHRNEVFPREYFRDMPELIQKLVNSEAANTATDKRHNPRHATY